MSVMHFEPQVPSVFTLLMIGIILFGASWRRCGITPAIDCTLSLASMVEGGVGGQAPYVYLFLNLCCMSGGRKLV